MSHLVTQAAWVLVAAFVLSFVYEVYRATAKAGTSQHDSIRAFVKNNIALYTIAAIVIALLFARFEWAPRVGLVFSGGVIAASILYYNPKILLERAPGIIDWLEDITFTGLLFVATGLLIYQVLGGNPPTLTRPWNGPTSSGRFRALHAISRLGSQIL